jgi:hypothetical protein
MQQPKRATSALAALTLALAGLGAVSASAPAAAETAGAEAAEAESSLVATAACSFVAPRVTANGSDLTASFSSSGCGGQTWDVTIQRHRYGPVWQNLSTNSGNPNVVTRTTCNPGETWTYRTVVQQRGFGNDRQDVSSHFRYTCR